MIPKGYISAELLKSLLIDMGALDDALWTKLFRLAEGELPYVTLTQKRVFEFIQGQHRRTTLQTISMHLAVPENTVHHALQSLLRRGAIQRDKVTDPRWTRGTRAGFRWYYTIISSVSPLEAFIQELQKLQNHHAKQRTKYYTRKTDGPGGVQGLRISDQKRDEAVRLYVECKQNKNQISKLLGITSVSVTNILKERGVKERGDHHLSSAFKSLRQSTDAETKTNSSTDSEAA